MVYLKGNQDIKGGIVLEMEKKILEFALKMEGEARDFYLNAKNKVNDPMAKSLVNYLADWELSHCNFIQDQLKKIESAGKWDPAAATEMDEESAREFLRKPWIEGELQSSLVSSASDISMLRMALALERDFNNFYKKAAEKIDNPDGKKVLNMLANWEAEHMSIIDSQLQQMHKDFMTEMGFEPF